MSEDLAMFISSWRIANLETNLQGCGTSGQIAIFEVEVVEISQFAGE